MRSKNLRWKAGSCPPGPLPVSQQPLSQPLPQTLKAQPLPKSCLHQQMLPTSQQTRSGHKLAFVDAPSHMDRARRC